MNHTSYPTYNFTNTNPINQTILTTRKEELDQLINSSSNPLATKCLNFFDDLAWLIIKSPRSKLTQQQRKILAHRQITQKTRTFRHIGNNREYFDKDLRPGDYSIFSWQSRGSDWRSVFAIAKIQGPLHTDSYNSPLIEAPLHSLYNLSKSGSLPGHELFGDGRFEDYLSFYQKCYPDRNISQYSLFLDIPFKVEHELIDENTLFDLYSKQDAN